MVPAGFLKAQFLQKLWIYEAFVVVEKLGWDSYAPLPSFKDALRICFLQENNAEKGHFSSPITTKAS